MRVSAEALETLARRSEVAACMVGGKVSLEIDGWTAALKPLAADRWCWENGETHGRIDLRAAGGWTVEVTVRASYLATHSFGDAHDLAIIAAVKFGELSAERVRRFDLAADFEGWHLEEVDTHFFVAPRRARVTRFHPIAKDEDKDDDMPTTRAYFDSAREVTGFTVCPGNPVMARIYDKTAQLEASGNRDRMALETGLWARAGYDATKAKTNPVVRVEIQLRGEALDELGLRDPAKLEEKLDAVWSYFCRGTDDDGSGAWLRLIDRHHHVTRKKNQRLDPRWQVARDVTFVHDVPQSPQVRDRRLRAAASSAQGLGCMRSAVASAGMLSLISFTRQSGERLELVPGESEQLFLDQMSDEECCRFLREQLRQMSACFNELGFWTEVERRGIRLAVLRFLVQYEAARARFSEPSSASAEQSAEQARAA